MSKKLIFSLIASILGLLFISLVGYFFIIQDGNVDGDNGVLSGFRGFLPFGGTENPNEGTNTQPEVVTNEETPIENNFTVKLRKISSEPVSGAGVLDIKAGTIIRHIEKATGHIFETETFSPKQGRISNTTIPLVYDAVWSGGAGALVARYLKEDDSTVDTYSLILKNASSTASSTTSPQTESTISGITFPGGISDVSSYGASVFYLQQSAGYSQGYISNFDGTKKKMLWNSEIKEVNSQYVNERTVALNTKPYQGINGFLYYIDTVTGQTRVVLPQIPGLSSLVSPDTNLVFYLEQGSGVQTFIFDTKNNQEVQMNPVTFPEKCVWSKKDKFVLYCAVPREDLNNNSLTSWYRGNSQFNDDIWKYNVEDGTSVIQANLSDDAGVAIDVIKPILSENEQYLVFINKIDNSLWSLDLTK